MCVNYGKKSKLLLECKSVVNMGRIRIFLKKIAAIFGRITEKDSIANL